MILKPSYAKSCHKKANTDLSQLSLNPGGSGLSFVNKSGKKLFVPAGSLDFELGIVPGPNIFWRDRSSWYEAGISAPKSEEFVE
jgi:hypothetical protein